MAGQNCITISDIERDGVRYLTRQCQQADGTWRTTTNTGPTAGFLDSIEASAGNAWAGVQRRIAAGVEAYDRNAERGADIAKWIGIAAIAAAVIMGLLALMYFAAPILQVLK